MRSSARAAAHCVVVGKRYAHLMRILHTSDWHIGRTFHGETVRDHLGVALAAIPEWVDRYDVDVVLVAGDIFDSSLPAAWAFEALTELLVNIREAGAQVILSSGNHDSAQRLAYMAPLTATAGVHVRADPVAPIEPVILHDEYGEVRFYPIPYLEPAVVRTRGDEQAAEVRTQADAITWAIGRIQTDLDACSNPKVRTVALAHCFAAGVPAATPGFDLERDLSAGGLDVVPVELFTPFTYVALGHIHSRMKLTDSVRYSGAPLHYSFTETGTDRGAWLIEFDAAGIKESQWLEFPIPRALRQITGTLDELLEGTEHDDARADWLQVTLTDALRPIDAMLKLRRKFPNTVQLLYAPPQSPREAETYRSKLAKAKNDSERIISFLKHVRNGEATSESPNWSRELEMVDSLIEAHAQQESTR